MRVAVVGGGLFGCTAALHARRAGHDVHLYEQRRQLMNGATGACYYRLHRGYHYPRSPETGQESLAAEASFRAEYGDCVIDGGSQFYAITSASKVSALEFEQFMGDMGLPYRRLDRHELISDGAVYAVEEPRIDAFMLGRLVVKQVEESGVAMCGPWMDARAQEYDQVVVATYAFTNTVLAGLGIKPQAYRFQVVEKPLVRLSEAFRGTSIVVMDHSCIDPHQYSELHALGHVSETIHAQNTGHAAEIPWELVKFIENGVIRQSETDVWDHSRIGGTVASIAEHIPAVNGCEYVGSMFTVRAVLDGVERTDARPTLVERLSDRVIRVFSGKLGTAVVAARQAVEMLQHERATEAA